MKDWSSVEVDRVYAALADWREQFQEHKSKVSPRMNAFKHKAKYVLLAGMPILLLWTHQFGDEYPYRAYRYYIKLYTLLQVKQYYFTSVVGREYVRISTSTNNSR